MPPVIAGSFTGDNGRVGSVSRGFRGWGGGWVEDEVTDASEDSGPKQVALGCGLHFFGSKELSFSFCNEAPCVPKLKHGCSIARNLGRYSDVILSPSGHSVASIPIRVLYSHTGPVGTAEDLSSQTTKSKYHVIRQVILITCKVT